MSFILRSARSNDSRALRYLFGTLHAGYAHWFPLSNVVEGALRRADIVAVETDGMANIDIAQAATMDIMFLPDGLTWAEFLPDDAYNHLVEMVYEWGLYYNDVNTTNPVLLVQNLMMEFSVSLAESHICFASSVDNYIIAVAKEMGVPIIGLESIEQQLDILFNPPFEVMLALVMHLFPPNYREAQEAIIYDDIAVLDRAAYYYERNMFTAINVLIVPYVDIICLYITYLHEFVMNKRSVYFANEIARLLRDTETPTNFFVAVGLSHLIRSEISDNFTDIIEQLRHMGFTVTQLWD